MDLPADTGLLAHVQLIASASGVTFKDTLEWLLSEYGIYVALGVSLTVAAGSRAKRIREWFSNTQNKLANSSLVVAAALVVLAIYSCVEGNRKVYVAVEERLNQAHSDLDSARSDLVTGEEKLKEANRKLDYAEIELRPVLDVSPEPFKNGQYISNTIEGNSLKTTIQFQITNNGKTPAKNLRWIIPDETGLIYPNSVEHVQVQSLGLATTDLAPGAHAYAIVWGRTTFPEKISRKQRVYRYVFNAKLQYEGLINPGAKYETTISYDLQGDKAFVSTPNTIN